MDVPHHNTRTMLIPLRSFPDRTWPACDGGVLCDNSAIEVVGRSWKKAHVFLNHMAVIEASHVVLGFDIHSQAISGVRSGLEDRARGVSIFIIDKKFLPMEIPSTIKI